MHEEGKKDGLRQLCEELEIFMSPDSMKFFFQLAAEAKKKKVRWYIGYIGAHQIWNVTIWYLKVVKKCPTQNLKPTFLPAWNKQQTFEYLRLVQPFIS